MLKEKITFTLKELCVIETALTTLEKTLTEVIGKKDQRITYIETTKRKLVPVINKMHEKQQALKRLPEITPHDRESR